MAAEWWIKPPLSTHLKVHIFNYTNLDDFLSGKAKKLKVTDLGPYTYSENATKTQVQFNKNSTVTFRVSMIAIRSGAMELNSSLAFSGESTVHFYAGIFDRQTIRSSDRSECPIHNCARHDEEAVLFRQDGNQDWSRVS